MAEANIAPPVIPADAPDIEGSDDDCPNCGGEGVVAGCFESVCVCGAGADPHECCSALTCDWCKGSGMSDRARRDAY